MAPKSKSKASKVETKSSSSQLLQTSNIATSENQKTMQNGSKQAVKKAKKNRNYVAVIARGNKTHQIRASRAVLAEIKRLQHSTKLIFPRGPFARLIKEISQQHGEFNFQSLALEAIQEATELFMIGFITDSYQLTRHRKRETLSVDDMQLLNNLLADLIPSLQPV